MSKYYDKMWGVKVSDYAMENGKCDYGTLARAFDCVMFSPDSSMWERFELVNGNEYNEYGELTDVFEYLFIEKQLCDVLMGTNEIVYYDPLLDVYVWGITHWGTSWDYVLTEIPLREIE